MKKVLISLGLFLTFFVTIFAEIWWIQNTLFSDLYENNENFDAIKYVKSSWIVKWYDDWTFKPNSKINRAEFLKIVLEAREWFDMQNAKRCVEDWVVKLFSDVEKNQWFAPYTCFAKENWIIEGYPDWTFWPSQEINLPEMAKIISLTQNLDLREKKDWEDWYLPYLEKLSERGAIPNSVSSVWHFVTRWEMAEVVYRIKLKITDKNSSTISELMAKVETIWDFWEIWSCQVLWEIMEIWKHTQPILYKRIEFLGGALEDGLSVEEAEFDSPAKDMAEKSNSASADDYSKTNIQVEWVDEADIVKNDWKYIYLIKWNQLRIVQAYPSSSMKEVSKITFDDEGFRPQELFLSENKLVVIWQAREKWDAKLNSRFSGNDTEIDLIDWDISFEKGMWYPQYWGMSFTKIISFDISDRSDPEIFRETSFEWSYSKSRKIWDRVYLVINKHPDFYNFKKWMSEENIIPRFKDSTDTNWEEKSLIWCWDVRFFPWFETPNFLTIASINIEDKSEEIWKKILLWTSENIYMSKNALYVATWVRDPNKWMWSWDSTKIYKFWLNQWQIEFSNTWVVEWRILNQFSMDEFAWNFRIATTTDRNRRSWWGEQESKLFILDSWMNELWKIEWIAPWERIKSVRFLWNKAYLVTFETMDPFFVIDLEDVENPKILWELKIPWWSDYLHPYDENHVIWFWKETREDAWDDWRLNWEDILWMKISIFDVSDLENPKEKFKYIIWERWTESDLLRDHKALLFDKEKNLLAFPVNIKETIKIEEKNCYEFNYSNCPNECQKRCTPSLCTEDWVCTADCDWPWSCVFKTNKNEIYTTFAWALILNIDTENWISERWRMSNYTESDYKANQYFYENWENKIQRIIYIWENLYSVSQNFIKSADIENVEINWNLQLEK